MTWRAIDPGRVGDIMTVWDAAPWPMTKPETLEYGVNTFHWQIGIEEERPFLRNTVDDVPNERVSVIGGDDRPTTQISFGVTDIIREITDESLTWLRDQLTLLIREGTTRWGKPKLITLKSGNRVAKWDLPGGARIAFSETQHAASVDFYPPDYADVLRQLGE